MATPQVQNDPIYNLPFLYITGLQLLYPASQTLDLTAGQCRDSNDVMDLVIGSPNFAGQLTPAPVSIYIGANGLNGLDTGSPAANTMYSIFLIGDSRYYQPTGAIVSLASNTQPLMPLGYDSYRLIGYWPTDGSANFVVGDIAYSANSSYRRMIYSTPIATPIASGSSTSYATVNLTGIVPIVEPGAESTNTPPFPLPIGNFIAQIYTSYVPNAAGNNLQLAGVYKDGGGNFQAQITGQVGSVPVTTVSDVWVNNLVVSSVLSPVIRYKVSSASDTVAISVAGFSYAL
jgi:hypothetical protein